MQSSTIDSAKTDLNSHHGVASHHEEHPDHRLFGLAIFLGAESMIFAGLFLAYLTFRLVAPIWPPEGTPERELLIPGVNTLILIASSFVMHEGNKAIKQSSDSKGLRIWFGATALLGAVFLAGQVFEYSNLEFGLKTNLYASTFYVLTGFHGLHVFLGLCLILAVLWRSRVKDHYSSENHFGVEAAELYWHFVDAVWIVLFILLYLL